MLNESRFRLAKDLKLTPRSRDFEYTWQAVKEKTLLTEQDLQDDSSYREALRECRRLLRSPKAWIDRAKQRSDDLAAEAARRPDVQDFRKTWLRKTLLRRDHVTTWIRRRATNTPVHCASVKPDHPRTRFKEMGGVSLLQYEGPDGWAVYVDVGTSPSLRALLAVTKALADDYEWQQAQAVAFVLTDARPLLWPIHVEPDIAYDGRGNERLRITVIISAPDVPPREVARAYQQVRQRHKAFQRESSSDSRRRQIALLHFVKARGGNPSRELAREWNRRHTEWRYPNECNFRRAYNNATSRQRRGFS